MSNEKGTLSIEEQGIDTISEEERKGTPASLFWPWFAANVSMFAMSYGAWALGFGISFWQATAMTIIGVVISFLLVGIISIAGKRGNAPTMVLTRATFGVEGAKVPAALSWIATLGWEISLTTTAVLALSSTIEKLGWGSGVAPKIISTIVVVGPCGGRRYFRIRPDYALSAGHHHRDRCDHRRFLYPRLGTY